MLPVVLGVQLWYTFIKLLFRYIVKVVYLKKLFLSSYFTEVADMFPIFVKSDCKGKKVVIIPTTALNETNAFYVDSDKASLQNLGLIVEDLEISNSPYEVIEKTIANADFIFVGGGNTFFLLQELKRTGTDRLITEHIVNGKPYISTSAGSCILSRNIVADGIDSPDAAPHLHGNFSALSIVDFYIYPHYGHNYNEELDEQKVRKYYASLDVKLISDKQVVTVDGEQVEIMTTQRK